MAEAGRCCRSTSRRAVQCLRRAGGVQTARRWASTASADQGSEKERVVILGSGWAGYALARKLSPAKATRILISPRSHFVFTPLLASTSVGTLEFRAAIEPVRRLGLAEFHQAWATDIDFGRKVIRVEANTRGDVGAVTGAREAAKGPEFDVAYDKLVLAVGCYSQTFGIEGVEQHACFLRDIGDARIIRLRVLEAFEKAALPTTGDGERRRLLHFAVVGGGPTGIEFAAELHDLVHEDLAKLYPALMPHVAISVYDIAPKVLPMFDRNLATYATDMFARQGIRVKTEHHLERIRRDGDALMLRIREEPDELGAGLVVWSTGLTQNPLTGRLLGRHVRLGGGGLGGRIARDARTGGIVTDGHMRVQLTASGTDHDDASSSSSSSSSTETTTTTTTATTATTITLPDVYAIGDCAAVQGQRLPATAQVASQQAAYLARQFNRGGGGSAFRFRNLGTMAYLGSWRAIHQSSADELKGWAAWMLWRTAYLTRSMSVRNKLLIPVYWLATWIFGRDISRF
ncbi:pyridine nucleotide-disulfide oxidoreductase [Hirsutella rhossiliensis]|uniref:Pyridine nucleotide-disulfide oxidoreductase domain-containing protein n=1 Tax=Hirsutella rhossiliensis TaxID=111463 RepID=A0A9P8N4P6_9HYPO|nr:pyridine nucleotide-disulfide oxidoreductase domain-containing protein [Hirsutella rhossiliensis]KAH0966805.1 pyridine nucleotide-disulfide oxidoreductase domain-containing protein [Hirsutella rhossiliensis]